MISLFARNLSGHRFVEPLVLILTLVAVATKLASDDKVRRPGDEQQCNVTSSGAVAAPDKVKPVFPVDTKCLRIDGLYLGESITPLSYGDTRRSNWRKSRLEVVGKTSIDELDGDNLEIVAGSVSRTVIHKGSSELKVRAALAALTPVTPQLIQRGNRSCLLFLQEKPRLHVVVIFKGDKVEAVHLDRLVVGSFSKPPLSGILNHWP